MGKFEEFKAIVMASIYVSFSLGSAFTDASL